MSEIVRVPENLGACPLCGGVIDYHSYGACCLKCKEVFSFEPVKKLWKNPYIVDISYHDPESSALSNLFPHNFKMDTDYDVIEFASMEAFLRTLCWNGSDNGIISEIARLSGYDAWRVRHALPDWRETQILYWNNIPHHRESSSYFQLLEVAYDQLFECSAIFREALKKTKGKTLIHSIGTTNPKETLLTPKEYISLLNRERNKLL